MENYPPQAIYMATTFVLQVTIGWAGFSSVLWSFLKSPFPFSHFLFSIFCFPTFFTTMKWSPQDAMKAYLHTLQLVILIFIFLEVFYILFGGCESKSKFFCLVI